MSDESQLQVTRKDDESSLILSSGRFGLISRGRRDAETIARRYSGPSDPLSEIHRRAEEGDADAQFALGAAYEKGYGVQQDCAEARRWYIKATDQGHAMAQNSLGTVQQELGIDPQSAEYFRKALDDEGKENAGWAYRVAASYSYGVGVPQDYAEAVRWWRIAISSVDLDCQNGFAHYMLGHAYHNGHGVPKDYVLAYMWYALAVEYSQYWHKPDEPEVKKRAESRDGVARKLAPQQLEEARRLAQQEAELDGHPDLNFTLGS